MNLKIKGTLLFYRLFATFQSYLQRQFPWPARGLSVAPTRLTPPEVESDAGQMVAYDENLLEKSHTQWQFGDWASLCQLEPGALQHHPDQAKLALLAAAGHQQVGDMSATRQFVRLAQDWGCSQRLVSQILIAGVYNTLGRAAAISNPQHRAFQHFESAIAIGIPNSDAKLLT